MAEADHLESSVSNPVGTVIEVDGTRYVLMDNFAEKNVSWKSVAMRHYEWRPLKVKKAATTTDE